MIRKDTTTGAVGLDSDLHYSVEVLSVPNSRLLIKRSLIAVPPP